MDFKKWLLAERYGQYNANNTIVVDIQPEYDNGIGFDVGDFASFLTQMISKGKKVLYFFNGESVGSKDNEESIKAWLATAMTGEEAEYYDPYDSYGDEESHESMSEVFRLLNNITFYDKGYAFFRGWMDNGVEESKIIQTIRAMITNRVYDSRELPEDLLEEIFGDEEVPLHDSINLPHIDLLQLRRFNNGYLCGGGRDECFREVQLLMNALNIKYRIMSKFVF